MENHRNGIPKANNTLQKLCLWQGGCPQYDPHRKQYFDGKFCIGPLLKWLSRNVVIRIDLGEQRRKNQ